MPASQDGPKVVRRTAPFYEVGEQGVTKEYASTVTRSAVGRLAKLVGPIALVNIKGVRLSNANAYLDPTKLKIGGEEKHALLLTRRDINHNRTHANDGYCRQGITIIEQIRYESGGAVAARGFTSRIVVSAVNVQTKTLHTPDEIALTVAHELAHSFLLNHCVSIGKCIMTPEPWWDTNATLVPKNPFCDEHIDQLRGYSALPRDRDLRTLLTSRGFQFD